MTGATQEYTLKIQGNFEMGEEMTTLVRSIYNQLFQKKPNENQDQAGGLSLNLGDIHAKMFTLDQANAEDAPKKILNELATDNKIYAIHESQHVHGDEVYNNIHSL